MFDKSNELVTRLVHFSKNILALKYGLPECKMVKTISTGAGKLYFTMNNTSWKCSRACAKLVATHEVHCILDHINPTRYTKVLMDGFLGLTLY